MSKHKINTPSKELTYKKLVYGVGINDLPGPFVMYNQYGTRTMCPYYRAWMRMLQRCGVTYQKKHPSYQGTTCCEEWKRLSVFKAWMEKQDWQDANGYSYQLDKDLLGPGDYYSPETCWFCEHWLNSLLLDRGGCRGEWPIGVSKVGKRFRAQMSQHGKVVKMGYYDTPEEAHYVWAREKRAYVIKKIEGYRNPKIVEAVTKKVIEMTKVLDENES